MTLTALRCMLGERVRRKEGVSPCPGTGKRKSQTAPVIYKMPERIDTSPDEIADAVLRTKPKSEWRYEQEAKRKREP